MTKDEIKKALEACGAINSPCVDCPYKNVEDCYDTLNNDALKLITEQENEIERLRTTLGQCNTELNSALESLKSQCREIGKLKAEVKQAKIDILNFLKDGNEDDISTSNDCDMVVRVDDIDELIAEVENETV